MRFALLIAALMAICLAVVGCLSVSPEVEQLSNDIEKTHEDIQAAKVELEKAAAQIERLWLLQEEVREKLEAGEITPEYAAETFAQLQKEAAEAKMHYDVLTTRAEILKKDLERMIASYKEAKGTGTPWYLIAWGVVSAVLNIVLKGALNDAIAGVEKGGHKPTKTAIAGLGNLMVNWLVKRRTPAVSTMSTAELTPGVSLKEKEGL